MNWGRGFFRLWILTSLFWIVLVAILLRPDALLEQSDGRRFEFDKNAQHDIGKSGASLEPLATERTLASFLGPTESSGQRDAELVLLQRDATTSHLRDRLMKFVVVALIPPWALLLFGFAGAWVIRGFGRD